MSNNNIRSEIIIGIVAPLGTDKKMFLSLLTEFYEKKSFDVIPIKLTELIFEKNDIENLNYCRKLKLYLKMQYCSKLRETYCKSIMACLAIKAIEESRNNNGQNNKVVYIIDQLKHPAEHKILSHVYGISYIQISLFSSLNNRDSFLKSLFYKDKENQPRENMERCIIINENFSQEYSKAKEEFHINLHNNYNEEILPDGTHKMMIKDMNESDEMDNEKKQSGQRVSDIFHLSHYFFNLDRNQTDIKLEINKFIQLLFGEYEDYPTQDEFGMALAYHGSYRSTFPHQRHIGACIISQEGEVISVASIRSPTPSANTKNEHIDNIKDGYNKYKDKIDEYYKILDSIEESNRKKIGEIIKFIKDSLDFHPTTHAEMAALADAAKLGISVRGSTLYVTTFPCHICAKDIITFGIKKVVYLEQYPKSKNAELYPNLISFDDEDTKDKIPFIIYSGISPRRYHYVYDLKNKPDNITNNKKSNNNSTSESKLSPKLLEYEKLSYNEIRETDIIKLFKEIVISINKNGEIKSNAIKNNQLYNVLDVSVKEKKDKS